LFNFLPTLVGCFPYRVQVLVTVSCHTVQGM